jgi:hypothetical protein
MLRSASKIIGHRLYAPDGEIGRAADFLLDDQGWTLRYMVVETGSWLSNRRVLISPLALSKADWTSRRLVLEGTREQVKSAPLLSQSGGVSRQHELDLARHYGWSVSGFGALSASGESTPLPEMQPAPPADPNLHSIKEVFGFSLQAADGVVGHVEDFIVDDDTWTLPYLVIDSRNWLSGRKILVPTEWVGQINWVDRQVDVLLPGWKIGDSPEYDPTAPMHHGMHEARRSDGVQGYSADDRASGRLPALFSPRSWNLLPQESSGTRGLRAALARIIHG